MIDYGDPAKDPQRVLSGPLPTKDYSAARLYALVTGHGQGNTQNCAEFCPKMHQFVVNGTTHDKRVWRDNCSRTATDGSQRGTWTLSRAGWCPGATVDPLVVPLPEAAERFDISYRPEAYTNLARTGYNDGSHTPPQYQMSAVVVLFRR
jgi:hypothetical protein